MSALYLLEKRSRFTRSEGGSCESLGRTADGLLGPTGPRSLPSRRRLQQTSPHSEWGGCALWLVIADHLHGLPSRLYLEVGYGAAHSGHGLAASYYLF